MKNKKITCKHCGQIIGFVHYIKEFDYKSNTIVSSNKNGIITKSKIRGTNHSEHYGQCEIEIGYVLETQLKCMNCNKHTTIKTENSY